MRLQNLLFVLPLYMTLATAAELGKMSTDELLEMRGTMKTQQEREALHKELQNRSTTMTPAQMERYFMPPENRQFKNRGSRGMGDGKIATH